MVDLNGLSAQEIGRRLRVARETAGIKQEVAAQFINVSRPTLISIEQGRRLVRIKELQILANKYGTSVNALLRCESVHTDLLPRFRRLRETEDADTTESFKLFNNLIKAEVELENLLGIQRKRNYPPERGINTGDVVKLAEKDAEEFRDFLGLSRLPINDIFSIIEEGLGIRLYQRKLPPSSKVAGLFTYDEMVGACIFINANHPLERRSQSAAHELGHFVGTRQNPEVLETDEKFLSREERYANAFGRVLMAPATSFSESFRYLKQITATTKKVTRLIIIRLANQYNISRESCVRRLEELDLVNKGTWEWFKANGGITDKDVKEVLGSTSFVDVAKVDAERPLPFRMSLMAHATWKQELLSEGQLSELLNLDRIELRKVIDEIELEERDSNELLKLAD